MHTSKIYFILRGAPKAAQYELERGKFRAWGGVFVLLLFTIRNYMLNKL